MTDELTCYYADLLDSSYACVDRIVLNAFNPVCHSAGGFRTWWRRLWNGSDEQLDDAHLMRMAGRFSRRLHAFAKSHGIPVIDCERGERKHEMAEEYLATHPTVQGLFLILVSRAVAPVWKVRRSKKGKLRELVQQKPYVKHYSFHILDREWGHVTIKMSGHPPFGAQIILNGHEYVACRAKKDGITFTKEGNCFTHISDAAGLGRAADTLSAQPAIGRLNQVCERWIYTCLSLALDSQEQAASGFRYQYSIYQAEYSRNLLFRVGGQMEQVFQGLIDRTRARLNVKHLKTIFGAKARPHRDRKGKSPQVGIAVETPTYDLTIFKLHFGKLTLKGHTKGERVLCFEAHVHNTRELGCGRLLAKFTQIVSRLKKMLEAFLDHLHCVDSWFIAPDALDKLATPAQVGKTRVGGVDPNKPRMRAALGAVLALVPSPNGFTISEFASQVRAITGQNEREYGARRASYDLKKIRGKGLVRKVGSSRHYQPLSQGLKTVATLVVLRERVIQPLLAGIATPRLGRKPKNWSSIDQHYETLRLNMRTLLQELGVAV
jgi:hypothetical protein